MGISTGELAVEEMLYQFGKDGNGYMNISLGKAGNVVRNYCMYGGYSNSKGMIKGLRIIEGILITLL